MLSGILNEIVKPEATISSSSSDLTREGTLVVAAKNGSGEAFEILLERYQRNIFAVAWRFTRVREDAETLSEFRKVSVSVC